MTLEKLLIFGFALAALLAITTLGTTVMQNRTSSEGDLQNQMDDLANSGN